MPSNTNMDNKANPNATVPILEFSLPISEVDADLTIGDEGEIRIPVEVIEVTSDRVSFRKDGKAEVFGDFKPETLDNMKERIGTVDDEIAPMHKKSQQPQDEVGE